MRTDLKYKILTIDNDPLSKFCFFCKREHDFFDDCGAFYIRPPPYLKSEVCCYPCWIGAPGEEHRKRYGCGER